jgi:uncharacterized phage-like protein YoqJ
MKMDNKEKTCCFSGHRDITADEYPDIAYQLELKVFDLVSQGFTSFYDGGAIGFDTLAAKTVIKARAIFPHVKLNLILPCKDQDKKWKEPDRNEYKEILSKADYIEYVSERYKRNCMFQRNRRIVDSSSVCLCYLNKNKGGTAYTVAYAKNQGVRIINIAEVKEWILNC